jgi:hypothetical protein
MKSVNIKIVMIISISLLIIISGCTGTNTETNKGKLLTEQPTATSNEVKPAPGSVQTVHFSKLIELLPAAPSGWTAEEPTGFTYNVESGTWSMANKEYTKGEKGRVSIGIMDSAYYQVGWFAAWKGLYKWESTEGYATTTTVKGYPAYEVYSKGNNNYGLYINVKDRFMVFITVDGEDKNTLTTFENAINLDGIGSLK